MVDIDLSIEWYWVVFTTNGSKKNVLMCAFWLVPPIGMMHQSECLISYLMHSIVLLHMDVWLGNQRAAGLDVPFVLLCLTGLLPLI